MSNATTIFLPWVRQGMAARIGGADPLTTPLPAQVSVNVALAVNGADAATMPVRLSGPGEVIGLDPRQVVRTEPPAGSNDYESNDLAAIEFDNPGLPWLFTPAAPAVQGRLRPWLSLVVVRQQPGVRLRPPRDEPLPVLEIAPPAVPFDELPDLSESWAWAHAQLSAREGVSIATNERESELRTLLAARPELSVSRLLCPRLLAPFTDYLACVVPAFEAGRRAGLGEAVDASAPLTSAWASGTEAPARISLPVYFHWEFRTGAREDFESMVARLAPRDLSGAVGRRPMDIGSPGFAVPATITPTVLLEGALQPLKAPRDAWPDSATLPWQQTLQSILNAGNARATAAEPVLGPPIYGRWYAQRHEVGNAPARSWLDELNLDPRERVAAALGTRVIQQQQEELMADAWQQAGDLARANQRLRQMQLSLAITTRLHSRHVARLTDDDALWRLAGPAQSRLVLPAAEPGAASLTMRATLAASSTPAVITSAAMRRMSRPRGAIARRATTAVRKAGIATAATLTTTNFFHLFVEQPPIMIFMLLPVRGLVSLDAVTRRLPPEHANIIYGRATDAAVAATPPRPAFVITPELTPVIGVFTGGVFVDGGALRARPRPGEGDLPEPREPPVRPPRPPRPPLPPRGDSPDAKAFREAAVRHLVIVNPQRPIIIEPLVVVDLELHKRPVLKATSVSMHNAVQALLDPAPALQRRMAATIRINGGGEAPSTIGPVGCSPVFPQPISEALAALSQDWLLPGLERVPIDSVALLEPNPRFIEAFMLGLNVEMGRELLWRDFPIANERASYFRRFWRAVNPRTDADILPIADWAERRLGENGTSGAKQLVLLVRSALFRRYPNVVVYAVPAVRDGAARKPGTQDLERHPLFRGSLQPDVSFFGFELDAAQAVGDPGWYFVIQQQPTEPRFGFDVEVEFKGASHVTLAAPPAGHALPPGTSWAHNAAHMARIVQQQPVRVAIHAGELLPPKS